MNNFFQFSFWGNTMLQYTTVLGCIMLVWIVLKLVKRRLLIVLKNIAAKSSTILDDVLVEMAERFVVPYLYLFINYNIIKTLSLSTASVSVLSAAMLFV